MIQFGKWAAMVAFAFVAAAATNAQVGMRGGPPQFHGVWNPVVGHGGVYEMTGSDGKKTTMQIAIVGKESVEGKDGFWMEMSFENTDRGEMVIKHLIVLDGQQTHVVKAVMQMPGMGPMEMPMQMLQRASSQSSDVRNEGQDLGSESVTVPAGTFVAEHYRAKDGGDVWAVKDVPPWGLVKFQGKDSSMVLIKIITDAKDKITGTPQPMNPMMMGQRPQ